MKIYFAAPLFSDAEQEYNGRIKSWLCKNGIKVHLPQDEAGLISDCSDFSSALHKKKIYNSDMQGIRECDLFVILLDGRAIDEGAAFELGVAYALRKICVGLKTDSRTLMRGSDNLMIELSLSEIFKSEIELSNWILERNF